MKRFFKKIGRFFWDRPTMSIVLLIGATLFSLIMFARHSRKNQRPWTCADYMDFPREHVPARCFEDFKPNAP